MLSNKVNNIYRSILLPYRLLAHCRPILTSLFLHTATFENFFKDFKTSQADASSALEGLHIDDQDLDDEDEQLFGAVRTDKTPKHKYMSILQKIANRETKSVTVDLDDLDKVCPPSQDVVYYCLFSNIEKLEIS